jgi:protein-tyrosine phosphatase
MGISETALDLRDLAPSQRSRLERFGKTQSVDIHCHCLPCVDDGPGTMMEALALCRALVEDGITTVVATPHQLGRYHGRNEGAAVREAVAALNRSLMMEEVPLRVLPGADVRIDERMDRLLNEDRVLTLADCGVYLLLELPPETLIDPSPLLRRLIDRGIHPIITHPERHRGLVGRPDLLRTWVESGAAVQLTAGSFSGDFGPEAQRAAWYWLETGQAALVATDAHHHRRRPPRMTEAIRRIARRLGEEVAGRVCAHNPWRVLNGSELLQMSRANETPVRPTM